ncbi:MAG: AAA family ATPase [Firmicutes bacterium]|nr:AAA family ATPase [Bacillota bacterium]
MYISKVEIKNFRVFDAIGITAKLKKGVNAIIGENNSGKSAFIDALRLAFSVSTYKKDIYFSLSDFHIDKAGKRANEAQIDIHFDEIHTDFFEIWTPEDNTKGEFHIRFYTVPASGGGERIKYEAWGGSVRGNTLSADTLDAIQISYFGALRDASSELKPSRAGKLGTLFSSITATDAAQESLVANLREANKRIADDDSVKQVGGIINENLSRIEREVLSQRIGIGLIEPRFETIAASLRAWFKPRYLYLEKTNAVFREIKNAFSTDEWKTHTDETDEGVYIETETIESKVLSATVMQAIERELGKTFEISQNGLGYNNLLFMAVVLGDIVKTAPDTLFNVLLVEEPEAHLHPQLQELAHRFFVENSDSEKVQAIYTSHSPTLVSRIGIDNLVLLFDGYHRVDCLSLSENNLDDADRSYLEKFLDVTKSQMLFAKGILFVEGISEALLLPELAKLLGRNLDRFAVEIVNIDGVSFKPFANLITFANDAGRKTIRAAIITDDDRCTKKTEVASYISTERDYDDPNIADVVSRLSGGAPSERFAGIETLCNASHIKLCGIAKTLEYVLASHIDNVPYILSAIIDVMPEAGKTLYDYIFALSNIEQKAACLWLYISYRSKIKASIMQALVRRIENKLIYEKNAVGDYVETTADASFETPTKIKEAIYFVTKEADIATND